MRHSCLLFPLLLAACGGEVVFQGSSPVPEGRWHRDHRPVFDFDIHDTVAQHDVYLDIRHTGDYPYSSLHLFVQLDTPHGKRVVDTVEGPLADPLGRWYGKGLGFIFADRFQARVLYRMDNRFPRKGRYTVSLEQAMRTEEIPGVLDVGISIERSDNGRR